MLTTAATVMCPHGGTVSLSTANSTVSAGGSPVCLQSDQHTVSGCAFTLPSGTPQPCVVVRWQSAATRCKVNGTGVLLQSSVGLCYSATQVPQGPAAIVSTQTDAKGT
jgi:hypothetical protein